MSSINLCVLTLLCCLQNDMTDTLPSHFHMTLDELLGVKITVASRTEEMIEEAPSSVTVYTRREILNMGVRHLEELMNFVPGFQTARTDEYLQQINAPAARGRRANATGLDILLLIDGQRINESWTGGWAALAAFITVENIKQVEFIRGPGSALYGSNAFLGVINVVIVADVNQTYLGGGSHRTYEGILHTAKKTRFGRFGFFMRQNKEGRGHFYRKEYGLTDFNDTVIETTDPLDSFDLNVSYRNHRDTVRFNFRESRREQNNFVVIGLADNDDRQPISEEATSLIVEADLISRMKMGLLFSGQYLDNRRRTQIPLFAEGRAMALGITNDPRELRGGDVVDNHQILSGLHGRYRAHARIGFRAGLTWRHARIDRVSFRTNFHTQDFFAGPDHWPVEVYESQDTYNFSPNGDPKGADGHRDIVGLYLQSQFMAGDHFSVTIGGRYDDYSDFGDTFNPRGALIYSGPSGTTLKAMYGEAFRAPSVQEQSEKSLIFVGNPELGPETVKTVELAWMQTFQDHGQVGITWFSTRLRDGVALAPGPPDEFGFSADRPGNVLALDLAGFEVEGQIAIGDQFVFRANHTRLTKTEEPRHLADITWSGYLNYSPGNVNLNLNGYYHSEVEAEAGRRLGAFWLLNLVGSYRLSSTLDVKLNLRNLLDEDYRTWTTSAPLQKTGLPGRGRAIFAGFSWRY